MNRRGGREVATFATPQVNIYSADVVRAVEFYRGLGFEETFRTPREGVPIHVELELDGFKLGIASVASAVADHGLDLDLSQPGRGMEIALWTDDTDAAFTRLVAAGARVLSEPHDWLGTLRVAWVADIDDNPIELVERRVRASSAGRP
ncbi:MAG TPA: VOC family protein [Gaiellaceae bacterium]|nr:VOC family protein [Gaiellaceae bacterium]